MMMFVHHFSRQSTYQLPLELVQSLQQSAWYFVAGETNGPQNGPQATYWNLLFVVGNGELVLAEIGSVEEEVDVLVADLHNRALLNHFRNGPLGVKRSTQTSLGHGDGWPE